MNTESNTSSATAIKLSLFNLASPNPQRLAYFYRDVLGANINEEYGGPRRIEIWFGENKEASVLIVANLDEGFAPRTGGERPWFEFRGKKYNASRGFEVRVVDADAEYKRICDLGVEVKEPPKDLPWGYRLFLVKDPDGNDIEICAPLPPCPENCQCPACVEWRAYQPKK